jgi:hypothetical protein
MSGTFLDLPHDVIFNEIERWLALPDRLMLRLTMRELAQHRKTLPVPRDYDPHPNARYAVGQRFLPKEKQKRYLEKKVLILSNACCTLCCALRLGTLAQVQWLAGAGGVSGLEHSTHREHLKRNAYASNDRAFLLWYKGPGGVISSKVMRYASPPIARWLHEVENVPYTIGTYANAAIVGDVGTAHCVVGQPTWTWRKGNKVWVDIWAVASPSKTLFRHALASLTGIGEISEMLEYLLMLVVITDDNVLRDPCYGPVPTERYLLCPGSANAFPLQKQEFFLERMKCVFARGNSEWYQYPTWSRRFWSSALESGSLTVLQWLREAFPIEQDTFEHLIVCTASLPTLRHLIASGEFDLGKNRANLCEVAAHRCNARIVDEFFDESVHVVEIFEGYLLNPDRSKDKCVGVIKEPAGFTHPARDDHQVEEMAKCLHRRGLLRNSELHIGYSPISSHPVTIALINLLVVAISPGFLAKLLDAGFVAGRGAIRSSLNAPLANVLPLLDCLYTHKLPGFQDASFCSNLLERVAGARRDAHKALLPWMKAHGFQLTAAACTEAAKSNHLANLKWLRANGCPWDIFTVWSWTACDEMRAFILNEEALPLSLRVWSFPYTIKDALMARFMGKKK